MTALTLDAIRDYCQQRSIGFEPPPSEQLFFQHCTDCRVYVAQFDEGAVPAFNMAWTMVEPELPNFGGALVWLSGRRADFQRGDRILARLREGWRVAAPIDDTPGYLFGSGELDEAVALMGLFMNFGWDAYWVPGHAQYMMYVNNDLFIDFAVRGNDARWDMDRAELFKNLDIRIWEQMTQKYARQ
jgi:hypothetical protein